MGCFKQLGAALSYSVLPCFSSSREREKRAVTIAAVGAGCRRHSPSFTAQSSACECCTTCAAQLSVNTCTFLHVPFTTRLSDQVVRESFPLATPRFTLPAPGCASQLPPLWIGGTCAQRSGGPTGRGLTGSASTTPPILPEIESPARKLI